jgi:putative phage-type endonuclease
MSLTQAELEVRKKGITGTDAPAIAGVPGYWRTQMDIWMDKKMPSASVWKTSPAMEWGNRLEEPVAQKYSEVYEVKLCRQTTLQHSKIPWLIGTPDRLIVGPEGNVAKWGLEIKTGEIFSRKEWGDQSTCGVPLKYLLQVFHYMNLTGLPRWDVAVLLGHHDFRVYTILGDKEVLGMLLELERRWYEEYIVGDAMPQVDHGESLRRLIESKWPRAVQPSLVIDVKGAVNESVVEVMNATRICVEAKRQIKSIKEVHDANASFVQAFMREHGEILFDGAGDGLRVTWKNSKDKEKTDWKGLAQQLMDELQIPVEDREKRIKSNTVTEDGPRTFRVYSEDEE